MIRNPKTIRAGINAFSIITVMMVGLMACDAPPVTVPADTTPLREEIKRQSELRAKAETKLEEQRTTTSRWQGFTYLTMAGAIFLLLLGVIVGSKAKNEADDQ